MRKLLLVVGLVLLAAVGAAEALAPPFVEARVEDQVRERTRGVTGVRADVGSFPLVTRVLLTGEVSSLTVHLEEVARQRLRVVDVAVSMRGIALDRGALLGGEVEVTGIDRGALTASIPEEALASALGVPVTLGPDQVSATAGGQEVTADLTVEGTDLVLAGAAGLDARVALPADILPCTPDVDVTADAVELSCLFEEVPDVLVRAATR